LEKLPLQIELGPNRVFVAPIRFGLEDKNQPTVGARPAFFGPPQFGRLIIEAALRAMRDAFIRTIVYNTKTLLFFINLNLLI
jgi:hypothetical protein